MSKLTPTFVVLAVVSAVVALSAPPAFAQEGFTLTAEFYHIVEDPGKSARIDFKLTNHTDSPLEVAIDFVETPGSDWNPRLMGRITSYEVRRVLVGADEPVQLKIVFEIPDEATPGDYIFAVDARTVDRRFRQTLNATVTVKGGDDEPGQIDLESRFPFLRGPTGAVYEFSITLRNRGSDPVTLDLSAEVPQGWDAAFKPSFEEKFLTSVSLEGNRSQNLGVRVTPLRTAPPGEYPVRVIAREGGREVFADFGVVLTGTSQIRLGTPTDRLNAKAPAGKVTPISLVVLNTGTGTLRAVDFIAQTPQGWVVKFEPDRIDQMEPEQIQPLVARVTPPGDAIPGDYAISIVANSVESSDSLDLRLSVTQSTVWGWVGLAIVIVVILSLVGLFLKLGRR